MFLSMVVLRSVCLASDDSSNAERDRLLGKLNRCKVKDEHLLKLILEKDAMIKPKSALS